MQVAALAFRRSTDLAARCHRRHGPTANRPAPWYRAVEQQKEEPQTTQKPLLGGAGHW